VIALLAVGMPPTAPTQSAAEAASSGSSILWPMFLLALFAVCAWKLFKFSRRHLVKMPKDWEDRFWEDFYEWRGDPTNRV